jgi:hypothetical protein
MTALTELDLRHFDGREGAASHGSVLANALLMIALHAGSRRSLVSIIGFVLAAAASAACTASSDSSAMNADRGADNARPSDEGQGDTTAERAIAEADIVQLADGRLYAMSKSGTVSIIDVSTPGRLTMLGQAYLPGEPFEMYLQDGLLIAMTNAAYAVTGQTNEPPSGSQGGQGSATPAVPISPRDPNAGAGVIVINVRDPGLISRVATFPVAGEIADSRLVGNILYLTTYETPSCYRCGTEARTLVTSFDLSSPSAMRQVDQRIFGGGIANGWGGSGWKRSMLVTNERIYVGGHDDDVPALGYNVDEGSIDVVDIGDPSGKLGKGAHLVTTGAIVSRWQMDEKDGVLRVVSQRGNGYRTNGIGEPQVQTFHVWNSGAIQPLGKTGIRLPRQEALKTVRFDGDRAYAITFAQTDPLFVIDLANASAPRQRGEIMMPGWVFHLAPHGNRLLGLGLDRADRQGHLNVSLFDVADMDHPRMLQRVSFGATSTTTDQAITSYELPEDQDRIQKAFRVLENGLIVVPFSGTQTSATRAGYDCVASGGGVQLIDWQQDALRKQATLPVAGNPRRALLNRGSELLAVSDSNVTAFDLGRRDVPLKTADLVIGSCESRAAAVNRGVPVNAWSRGEGGFGGNEGGSYRCSTNGAGAGASGAWGGILLGLALTLGAVRRRRVSREVGAESPSAEAR